MENASKALIIAGGMLLAMMIVGLLTWGYGSIRNYEKAKEETERLKEIVEYNKTFESYNKANVRGYQMISLANLANDTNTRYAEDGYKTVNILVKMSENSVLPKATQAEKAEENKYREYYDMIKYVGNIYDNLNTNEKNEFKLLYFECEEVEYDKQNGRIVTMKFKQVKPVATT